MAVCRLAILDYRDKSNCGGYDAQDLQDCINFAEWELEQGIKIGFDGQDWHGFIKWGKQKLEEIKGIKELKEGE